MLSCEQCFVYFIYSFPFLLDVGGLGFEYVVTGWRYALRSEWSFNCYYLSACIIFSIILADFCSPYVFVFNHLTLTLRYNSSPPPHIFDPNPPLPQASLLAGYGPLPAPAQRPYRDLAWLLAFFLVLLAAFGGGLAALLVGNHHFAQLASPGHLADLASCPLPQPPTPDATAARHLLSDTADADTQWAPLLHATSLWIGLSAGGSLVFGLMFLYVVRFGEGPGCIGTECSDEWHLKITGCWPAS